MKSATVLSLILLLFCFSCNEILIYEEKDVILYLEKENPGNGFDHLRVSYYNLPAGAEITSRYIIEYNEFSGDVSFVTIDEVYDGGFVALDHDWRSYARYTIGMVFTYEGVSREITSTLRNF